MELFKGSLHYRCALPGYVEPPGHPSLLDDAIASGGAGRQLVGMAAAEGVGRGLMDDVGWRLGRRLKGGGDNGEGRNEFDSGVFCNPNNDM